MGRGDGGTYLGEGGRAAFGLTDEQVAERVRAGQVNANADVKTKSVWQILCEHTFTLFNAVNVAMAALVVSTGSYKNVAFMVVVASNLVIGVFQEIRAKRKVDRLSILTAKDVCVLRAGEKRHVPVSEVVRDDVVLLAHGDQVPADGVVLEGSPRMDESLLTGESNAIEKSVGDEVLSGSFVDSGAFAYRVTRVGRDAYAAQINAEAKYVKRVHSEILSTLSAIIRLGTIALVPLGAGLFARIILMGRYGYNDAVLQTVAAVVGMIPQGLVLLTSSVFAIATTRLASRSVLVQQSYCVETLARVDVLCLDKTGTITTGAMEVAEVRGDAAQAAVTIAAANEADANETARAILEFGRERGVDALAVTRARSFPGLMRVLVVARVDGFAQDGSAVGTPRVIGFLGIRDQIRPTAARTMGYFREQGVDIRVISGDDPRTASNIAAAVGVPGAEKCVDASTLETDADVAAAVAECRVFGRVTPRMKRRLVRTLREAGHVVAMTGDGVNDVLALKDADCSVAMASGSAAARNVAEIVLADNDFAHLPEVVAEGRRSINNLQRSASLFLMKTVYSAVLALVCIALPPYPFIPVQMSLVSTAIIGTPSFLLALEPNHERVRGSFVSNVLRRSLPASIAITVMLFSTMVIARVFGWDMGMLSTTCMIEMFAVGLALVWRISRPLNALRVAVLVMVVALAIIGCTVFGSFFSVTPPTLISGAVAAVSSALGIFLFLRAYDRAASDEGNTGLVSRVVARVERAHES